MKPLKRKYKYVNTLYLLFVGVVIFHIFWFILALFIKNKALPNPVDVYKIFPQVFSEGMALHAWASLRRVFWGILIALVIGIVGGVLTALGKTTNKMFQPLLYLSYPIPKLALLPIIMIFFGIGENTKVIMIVLIIVFQLMISIRDSIQKIPKENYFVLSSLRATKMQYVKHVMLPGTLPDILSALRVTVGIAISVLFVTETFGTDKGLGFFIVDAWMRLDYLTMYVGIITISVIGFIIFTIIDVIDNVFCRWNKI